MDGSSSREGGVAMKPTILRVGLALVLTATGLILAKFVSRKEDKEITSSPSNQESRNQEEEEETESIGHRNNYQENLNLKSSFEELQRKEQEMEMNFKQYCFLKDQEVMLIEYKNTLLLEKSQLGFLHKEVLAMEEEHKRGQDLVIVYLKMVGEIQEMRLKNRFLERQAKKLKRRTKGFYRVLVEKNMRSISVEKDFLRCLDELEKKNNIVKELEVEVKDLKTNVDVLLQKEKEEVYNKFSNSEQAMVSVEEYKRVIEEYEGLKKDLANGVSEVISLRWSNACLRHKAMMRNETSYEETTLLSSQNQNLQEMCLEEQVGAMALTLVDNEHHEENHDHHHESSRRKRLMKNLKRWVEGNGKGRRQFLNVKLEEEEEEEHMFHHSRRSCSSV